MKSLSKLPSRCSFLSVLLLMMAGLGSPAEAVVWLPVGNAGNLAQSAANRLHGDSGGDGFGSVSYDYMIGRDMVTNSQYVSFLNSVDATGLNPSGIYNSNMKSDALRGGIEFISGNLDGSKYSAILGREDWPVVYVSWFDTARFSNWMTNGMGPGDTETGAYTLIGGQTSGIVLANPDFAGMVRVPTENEWFKAAYYDPATGNYSWYATRLDTITTAQANYNHSVGTPTPVGSYLLPSFYGTFDQSGNAWEWNDAVISLFSGSSRGLRGGSWLGSGNLLRSSFRNSGNPTGGGSSVGFRVAMVPAMVIPEPARMSLLMMFGLVLLARRRR